MPPLFADPDYASAPADDCLEVTLLGPGFGESALVHLGDGRWMVIDSFRLRGSRKPAPLKYLEDIGVDPSRGIYLVLASHWDDDHLRGLGEILTTAPSARFLTASAFEKGDFLTFAIAHDKPFTERQTSRVKEILAAIRARPSSTEWANNAKIILDPSAIQFSHRANVTITSLSPCNGEVTEFLKWIAAAGPRVMETRRAAQPGRRNELSVVLHVSVGETTILLGGDLEDGPSPQRGWSAILSDPGRPRTAAQAFKVPHHGSETAHNADVWHQMLSPSPLSMIAPWRRGKGHLPSSTDVARILNFTESAFVTNTLRTAHAKKRSRAVEKTIAEAAVKLRSVPDAPGLIRARRSIRSGADWDVRLYGAARPLKEMRTSA